MIAGAVAVYAAGGVGFAVLRPSSPPVEAPVRPAVTAEVSLPPAPVGRAEIPEAAIEPVRRSPR